jgi:hypothetical protein
MNNTEIMKLANVEAPELVHKTAELVADLEENYPEFGDEVMADFRHILDRVRSGLEKNASVASAAVQAAKYIGSKATTIAKSDGVRRAGYAVAAGLGAALATDLYDAARRGLSKGGNMKRILDANPDLKRQVRDQKELYVLFNTLHRFAPDLTSDPMLGGAMMMQMVNTPPELRVKLVQELISSRKNVIDSKQKQLGLGVMALMTK